MEVRDDGVGLSEDALTALQKGIGVSTTRARLQHLFGADYRFEFHRHDAGAGGGRRVSLARRSPAGERRRPADGTDPTGQPDRARCNSHRGHGAAARLTAVYQPP